MKGRGKVGDGELARERNGVDGGRGRQALRQKFVGFVGLLVGGGVRVSSQ